MFNELGEAFAQRYDQAKVEGFLSTEEK